MFDLASVRHADASGGGVGMAEAELERDDGGIDAVAEAGLDDGCTGLLD